MTELELLNKVVKCLFNRDVASKHTQYADSTDLSLGLQLVKPPNRARDLLMRSLPFMGYPESIVVLGWTIKTNAHGNT